MSVNYISIKTFKTNKQNQRPSFCPLDFLWQLVSEAHFVTWEVWVPIEAEVGEEGVRWEAAGTIEGSGLPKLRTCGLNSPRS